MCGILAYSSLPVPHTDGTASSLLSWIYIVHLYKVIDVKLQALKKSVKLLEMAKRILMTKKGPRATRS